MSQGSGTEPSTEDEPALIFGSFCVETAKRLWRDGQLVEIRPRPLAMLRYLAERPHQLVTKEELLKRLWPGIYVTKTVLKVCMSEIRQALADNASRPQFIQTVGTEGYRFIAPIATTPPVPSSQFPVPSSQFPVPSSESEGRVQQLTTDNWQLTTLFVGREQELARMHTAFARAQRGERQIMFVSGEAGIGKTTVVDRFLDQVRTNGHAQIGRGQCIEQHGSGEAYLPVLEALGQLCREPGGEQVVAVLRRYAPMWLVQLPGVLETRQLEVLQRQVYGSSRERMLREFVEALDLVGTKTTVVLVLEDLQWSDISTLELLAYLAQRRGRAQVLVLGTYRSADVVASGHPLRRVVQELHGHGQCEDLALELLSEEEVEEYLRRRFPGSPAVTALSPVISRRTDGNALFTVNFVDYLIQQGVIVEADGQWQMRADTATIQGLVPETVQRLIVKQVEGLSKEEQRLLEVASVVGITFTAAEVAGVTGRTVEDVEEVYENLASLEQFIEVQGITEWPDRTLTARYSFRHALYQHVVYERIGQVQRVRLHRQLGEWLARTYGERAGEIAVELAVHCEEGRNYQQAVRYRQQAGETALRRNAYQEAQQHLTQGVELLQTLPDTQERKQQELALRIPLNAVLLATHGLAATELEQNLQRARELCREVSDPVRLVPVLIGLTRLHMMRADRAETEELMEQERRLLERIDDPASLVQLYTQIGTAEMVRGAHVRAREYHRHALNLDDPEAHRLQVFSFGGDPKVVALAISGWSLCLSGWLEQAWSHAEQGIIRAEELSHPLSLIVALLHAAHVRQFRGELDQAGDLAQRFVALRHKHSFALYAAWGPMTQGSILVQRGELAEGIALLTTGLAQYRAMGSQTLLPYFLSFLAEGYLRLGQAEEGMQVVLEALHLTETIFDRFWEAELHRLQGEISLAQSRVRSLASSLQKGSKFKVRGSQSAAVNPHSAFRIPHSEAEACFHKAIEVACQQDAKSLELRAVMSLARLWQSQDKKAEARQRLAEIYGWFTEGFDTADLRDSKALLEELA